MPYRVCWLDDGEHRLVYVSKMATAERIAALLRQAGLADVGIQQMPGG